jgi:hypothetical protein
MNVIGILMGIALNIKIAFDNIAIFTMLILPIHEQGDIFPSYIVFNDFFLQWFVDCLVESFASFVKLILVSDSFEAIVN